MSDDSRQIEILQTLAELKTELREHRNTEEAVTNNQYRIMQEIREGLKEYKTHTDSTIHETQVHFVGRISECYKNTMNLLETKHMNKDQIRGEITKAITAAEKRLMDKVKLIGWVVAVFSAFLEFLSKYGHVIPTILDGGGKNG